MKKKVCKKDGGSVKATKAPPKPAKKPAKDAQDYKDAQTLKKSLESAGRAEEGDRALMKMNNKYKCGGRVKKKSK